MRLSLFSIRIYIYHTIFTVIECCYYPLSTHEVISALYYYLNLYAKLNDVIITCIYASRGGARVQDLDYLKKKQKINIVRHDFEMIVKKIYIILLKFKRISF
jgi:hypothetical protein